VAKGIVAPSIVETKAIAEEGFIYGLPLVMNYAVMYEFTVDTKSSQFKAPFNEINNQHHVATYEDTAVVTPNSDTPYSTGRKPKRWTASGPRPRFVVSSELRAAN
jgi:hypothetical protein